MLGLVDLAWGGRDDGVVDHGPVAEVGDNELGCEGDKGGYRAAGVGWEAPGGVSTCCEAAIVACGACGEELALLDVFGATVDVFVFARGSASTVLLV